MKKRVAVHALKDTCKLSETHCLTAVWKIWGSQVMFSLGSEDK
jgi:hypothetical protein